LLIDQLTLPIDVSFGVAIRKVYSVLADVVHSSESKLQVIVLDPDDVLGSIGGVHLVKQWRHGNKLIPTDWLA